jgi:imidazolonepropionase-like amidohydrolase
MAALRSATVVPRDYFRSLPNGGSALHGRADFGTVEAGARADLILLRGDPSQDLAALRRLDTVIAAGRVHDRAALDAMLDEASRAAKAQ